MKIAIVDDSRSVRLMISICLEDLEVDAADIYEFNSAAAAYDDFQDNFYDLIFCDLHMPEMNGDELVEKIHHYVSHLGSSRVIMISGEENPDYKTRLKALNVHQFIKKPIKPESFMHHVKPYIQRLRRNKED
ncbi:response regulator [Sulfurimonas sp. MAG313]|nr:response regulator [Sulfurimonas sp. MAG313]MDF1880300.1 response regulator [Sulfurimonas sp. MAG313]